VDENHFFAIFRRITEHEKSRRAWLHAHGTDNVAGGLRDVIPADRAMSEGRPIVYITTDAPDSKVVSRLAEFLEKKNIRVLTSRVSQYFQSGRYEIFRECLGAFSGSKQAPPSYAVDPCSDSSSLATSGADARRYAQRIRGTLPNRSLFLDLFIASAAPLFLGFSGSTLSSSIVAFRRHLVAEVLPRTQLPAQASDGVASATPTQQHGKQIQTKEQLYIDVFAQRFVKTGSSMATGDQAQAALVAPPPRLTLYWDGEPSAGPASRGGPVPPMPRDLFPLEFYARRPWQFLEKMRAYLHEKRPGQGWVASWWARVCDTELGPCDDATLNSDSGEWAKSELWPEVLRLPGASADEWSREAAYFATLGQYSAWPVCWAGAFLARLKFLSLWLIHGNYSKLECLQSVSLLGYLLHNALFRGQSALQALAYLPHHSEVEHALLLYSLELLYHFLEKTQCAGRWSGDARVERDLVQPLLEANV